MPRILLVHWKPEEVPERLARLRGAGYEAAPIHPDGPASLRALREDPPDAIVIDLGRTPSHGREFGAAVRRQAGTRGIPLVFVDGAPKKVADIRALLPDATFSDWSGIRSAVREAIRRRPETPVVPGVFDAYSGTPLPKKMGFRERTRGLLLGAPAGFAASLEPLPAGATLETRTGERADLVVLFAKSQADLSRRLAVAIRAIAPKGSLWICWPKKASGISRDLTQAAVRAMGMAAGLVDYKVAAIDATWSGLRFARKQRAPR